jgi:hypothetical protein
MVISIISITLSCAALVISIVVARSQLKASRDSDSVTAMLSLFSEYRQDDLKEARREVFQIPESQGPYQRLGELRGSTRAAGERVAHFFDHVGLLIAFDLIPAEPMVAFFGFGCHQLWQKLSPFIEAERQARDVKYYLGYFEMFANLAARRNAETINASAAERMRKL